MPCLGPFLTLRRSLRVGQTIAFRGLLCLAKAPALDRGEKTPAFRPVGRLKRAPLRAAVFHEISRAEGPGQQTTKGRSSVLPLKNFSDQANNFAA
jgi:hypothetical protein